MIFPIEIWEQILWHCEAFDLMRFQSVCSQWKVVIPAILKKTNKWYNQCMKDIPFNQLNMIVEKRFPYSDGIHFKKYANEYRAWEGVYKSWKIFTNLSNSQRKVCRRTDKFYAVSHKYEYDCITCIATSGSLLAVATSDGCIRFYNMYDKKREPMFTADHGASVCDIKIMENESYIIAISLSHNKVAKFWNVLETELISDMNADIISVSHGFCYLLHGNVLTRKGFDSSESYTFDDQNLRFHSISADKNTISLYSSKGKNIRVEIEENEWKFENFNIQRSKKKLSKYKVFKHNILTYISYDGTLSISANCEDWVTYDVFSVLKARPTCVYYYNGALILGVDIGDVYIYHVNDSQGLTSMNLNPNNACFKVELCTSPISALDILEHKRDQIIVATCEKFVYLIKLD